MTLSALLPAPHAALRPAVLLFGVHHRVAALLSAHAPAAPPMRPLNAMMAAFAQYNRPFYETDTTIADAVGVRVRCARFAAAGSFDVVLGASIHRIRLHVARLCCLLQKPRTLQSSPNTSMLI